MTVATICFSARESGDEAVIVVRVAGKSVGLTLSLRRGGDIEAFFGPQELDQLSDALGKARGLLRASE